MKTLYLHCGYHKTGSSFLQTLFARNRDKLIKDGIYFPASEREYDMIKGNISPGNGPELASALSDIDVYASKDFLNDKFNQAQNNKCNALLLSSEALFHSFEKRGALECLTEVCKDLDIGNIRALVYFRDPVSHSLSTYKHRAKNGNIEDLSDWLNNDYETMDLLKKFTDYRSEYPIDWTCRKYMADSEFMARTAFVEWLNVFMPAIPEDDEVNVSLTFSEIRVIQSLKNMYPNAIDHLKREFSNLSQYAKGHDKKLKEAYKNIAAIELQSYRKLVDKVNKSLGENEKLILPDADNQNIKRMNPEILLSEEQIQAIGRALNSNFESDTLKSRIKNLTGKAIEKIKRLLIRKRLV